MIACVFLPDIVSLVESRNPDTIGKPVLLINAKGKVQAASFEAVQQGVTIGMRTRQAHAYCPNASLVTFNEQPYRELAHSIGDALLAFSTYVELMPGFWKQEPEKSDKRSKANKPDKSRKSNKPTVVHLSGAIYYLNLGKLHKQDALAMGRLLQERLKADFQLEAWVGLASGKFTACVAARHAHAQAPKLIPRGYEARYLAHHSIDLLPLSKKMKGLLHVLGIHKIGEFAALPVEEVMEQFGKKGKSLHTLARGIDKRPVLVRKPKPIETFTYIFDDAIDDQTILERLLEQIGCEAAERLNKQHLAAKSLQLKLQFDNRKTLKVSRTLREPMNHEKLIARTLLRLLRQLELSSGVVEVHVQAEKLKPPVMRQLDLFGAFVVADNRLADLLDTDTTEGLYHIVEAETDHWMPEYHFIFEPLTDEVA